MRKQFRDSQNIGYVSARLSVGSSNLASGKLGAIQACRLVHVFELAKNSPFKPNPNHFGRLAQDYPVAYASEHLALAAGETLGYWAIHADLYWYGIFACNLEKGDTESALETDPQLNIKDTIATQRFGDEWIRHHRTLALAVLSVRLPFSTNIRINANHPDFNATNIEHLGAFHMLAITPVEPSEEGVTFTWSEADSLR